MSAPIFKRKAEHFPFLMRDVFRLTTKFLMFEIESLNFGEGGDLKWRAHHGSRGHRVTRSLLPICPRLGATACFSDDGGKLTSPREFVNTKLAVNNSSINEEHYG